MDNPENGKRAYRSELRKQQAEDTRRRIVDAAAELFSEHGYPGTTLAEIARRAGVSVETVQKNGPKSALMRAAVGLRSFGDERDLPLGELSLGRQLAALTDRNEVAPLVARTMRRVNADVAGVWTALAGAALGDPELREYYEQLVRDIREQNRRGFALIAEHGWLRDDLDLEAALDTWTVLASVEAYLRLVEIWGRSADEYEGWLIDALEQSVLAPKER